MYELITYSFFFLGGGDFSVDEKRQCWMNRRNALAQILFAFVSFPLVSSAALADSGDTFILFDLFD